MVKEKFKVDFIGIGAARAGSTRTASILEQHPEVCFSSRKEINFFNEKSKKGYKNKSYELGLEFYRTFWPKKIPKGKKTGEFSPNYISDEKASENIKKAYPNAKIIVALRNPIGRAYSAYLWRKNNLNIPEMSFEKSIQKYSFLLNGGLYYKQLKKYYDIFPKKQIKIILLNDIIKEPKKIIKELYEFIDINPNYKPKNNEKNESTFQKRKSLHIIDKITFRAIEKILGVLFIVPFLKNSLKKLLNFRIIRKIENIRDQTIKKNRKTTTKSKINEKTRRKPIKYFKKDIKELERLINKDLSNWLK